jgi:predicted DNA-binding protein
MPKKAGAKKMPARATPKRRLANAVRLDLSDRDFERLERVAEERGLNKASYARMAVLAHIKQDEEKGGK